MTIDFENLYSESLQMGNWKDELLNATPIAENRVLYETCYTLLQV